MSVQEGPDGSTLGQVTSGMLSGMLFFNLLDGYPEPFKCHLMLWGFAKIEDLQNRLDYFGEDADIEQAIVDVAVENSLVTDYTSMIVLPEEWYEELGINRLNRARVEKELLARQERALQGIRDNRVDNNQPMYSNPRAGHANGGGAFGPWMLLLLLPPLLLLLL